jgi:hypothetical protein
MTVIRTEHHNVFIGSASWIESLFSLNTKGV